ncbi:uncharacterized protein LOC143633197 [Bidens hawaiensis]|uniref:uncharacterized protein LOC143633197 n=1 Tax=Bidens hawaiensis TaxID=980011 RepID=UPI0040492598
MESELFKIHCKAFMVFPRQASSSSSTLPNDDNAPPKQTVDSWERLDSIVQWIYGTISNDLLNTILKKDTTAWETLTNIFQDNQITRALHLQNKLLDNFPNAFAYCQEIKVLLDQLANVGKPLDDS